jgi:hypothetical protein
MQNDRLLKIARRLERMAKLSILAKKKRKKKRKDFAGSIADGLDVTPGVGGDAGGDGGGGA